MRDRSRLASLKAGKITEHLQSIYQDCIMPYDVQVPLNLPKDVGYPVTGYRTRPTWLYLPKKETTSVSWDGQTGFIELYVYPPKANLWSVVQWEDSEGGWHVVEGRFVG